MATCTSSKIPGKDGAGVASGTLRYLHNRRSQVAYVPSGSQTAALEGVLNPEFLALGLGGTNLMAMLWAVAMGKRAIGVELRGDPSLGVHWNIREDLFHQLRLIDEMMLNRYAETEIPRRDDGRIFSLADCFYSSETKSGDVVPDEIIDGYDTEQHIVGTIQHIEYIDDRYKNGIPSRAVTELPPPAPPVQGDPFKIRSKMQDVLDGPSTFQAAALAIQVLLRRYLDRIEEMDLASGKFPRVRLFTQHRVVEKEGFGFVRQQDGRMQVRIEEIVEMDFKGKTIRLRSPGSDIIDLGVPELFCIAQGAHSSDAQRLGFSQHDVEVDHDDGQGPIVAQADYVAGLFELLVDGRLRRRIASHFDQDGNEYWIRQIAVGHENDPEVAWVLTQVPDYMTFDPIEAGLVSPNTCDSSPEYHAAYQILLQDFFLEQAALILGMKVHELRKVEQVYGPKLFSLVERRGDDARIAPNGVVAGDSFGNGHFLTSAGAMTGMIGHSFRFLEHWQRCVDGLDIENSIRQLADSIKNDTEAWLNVSAKEFTEAIPINFGKERGSQIAAISGIDPSKRASNVAMARKHRHSLIPLDPSDWRRLFLKNGRILSSPLPPISPNHPHLAEWKIAHPKASTATTADDPDPSQVMMGAGPMRSSAESVLKNDMDLLKEEIAWLRLQQYGRTYDANNETLYEPGLVGSDGHPSLHTETSPATKSRRSDLRSHSSSQALSLRSEPVTSGSENRARKLQQFQKKMELVRQREEIYRQIQDLSLDTSEVPPEKDDNLNSPLAPSHFVAKVLANKKPTRGAVSAARSPASEESYFNRPKFSSQSSESFMSVTSPQSSRRRPSDSLSLASSGRSVTPGSSISGRSSSPRRESKGMLIHEAEENGLETHSKA